MFFYTYQMEKDMIKERWQIWERIKSSNLGVNSPKIHPGFDYIGEEMGDLDIDLEFIRG